MAELAKRESPRRRSGPGRAWGLLLPALLWTVAFFVMPLVIMGLYSLWQRVGTKLVTDLTLGNYENAARRYDLEPVSVH